MNEKKVSKRGRKNKFLRSFMLAVCFIVLGIFFLITTFASRRSGSVHKMMMETVGPAQKTVTSVGSTFGAIKRDYIDGIQNTFRLKEENKRLTQELEETRARLDRAQEAMADNASLKKLLGFKDKTKQASIAATIVGKDPSPFFRSVIIDRGTNSGVTEGSPVVCSEGVVGQVFATSPNYAKVLLAIAPASAIDVCLQKSRVRGILKGTGFMSYSLEYILKDTDVKEGDLIVTSCYGGEFPTGLPVGTVAKISPQPRGMFHEIEVKPAVDYKTLEFLLVIQKNDLSEIQNKPPVQ